MNKKKRKFSSSTFINSRVTTTVSIVLVLFLLGLVVLLPFLADNLSSYVKETLSFDIILQDNMGETQIKNMQRQLEKMPFAKSTVYVSKKDAIKQLEKDLGQNPEEFLGFNPLPALITVHLKSEYANMDSLSIVEKQLKSFSNNIKETEYRKELLQTVNENITKVGFTLFFVAAILLFISIALINNTIQLIIYSKRFTIHTMQLVGAKKNFIRKPFIKTNVLLGITAAVIADGLLYWLVYSAEKNMGNLHQMIDWSTKCITGGSVLALGIIIPWIATYFAVNRYISADVNTLHKI
jgi:cell division transport system permease protein